MAAVVGGRILIRHLDRCETGRWDTASGRAGGRGGALGERGAHVAFWGALFFSNLNILVKVQKGLVRGKTRGSFSLFAPHMSQGFFFLYSTIWLSERFPSVIKSYAIFFFPQQKARAG